jgi:hypothetical protein
VRSRWNLVGTLAAVVAMLVWVQVSIGVQAPAGQRGGGAGAGAPGAPAAPAAPGAGGAQRGGGRGGRGGQPATPAGPVPRLPNGKPDLSGHWSNPYTSNMSGRGALDAKTRMPLTFARQGEVFRDVPNVGNANTAKTFDLPYTEWGLKHWKEYDPVKNGDYAGNCMPFGMSRNINSPHGLQMIQNNDALAILFEQNTWFHWIPTNGMKWPDDIPDSWNGVSTGHWDGDTLIVETKGFNGYTKLDTAGHPHSKGLVLINTFLRTDSRTIQHTVTVHDPKAYTVDWMNVRTWTIKQDTDPIMEYSCEENNGGIWDGAITRWKKPTDEELEN